MDEFDEILLGYRWSDLPPREKLIAMAHKIGVKVRWYNTNHHIADMIACKYLEMQGNPHPLRKMKRTMFWEWVSLVAFVGVVVFGVYMQWFNKGFKF